MLLFYCRGGRPVSMQKFRLIVYQFLHGCGLYYNVLSRRKTSFYAKFQITLFTCFYNGCGVHYNVLSGLSVKPEVKG